MRRSMMVVMVAGVLATVGTLTTVPDAGAQAWGRDGAGVPPGHRPPPGMCRIWIDGVPAGRQPAPTDCASAVRNRPSNGRVIFGDDDARPGQGKGSARKGKKGASEDEGDSDKRRGRDMRRDDRGDEDSESEDTDRRRRTGSDARTGPVYGPGATPCADRDGDGRCDDVRGGIGSKLPRSGSSLPSMEVAAQAQRGERSSEMTRWLGTANATARTTDADRDGRPERVTWVDRTGRVLQIWTDDDRDGRADRVEVYENGRRVQVVGQ